MSKEAMKLALEAIKELHSTGDTQVFDMYYAQPVIKALEEALAKREQGEPVAWRDRKSGTLLHEEWLDADPLYTTPQQRTWVELTDEEVRQMCGSVPSMKEAVREAEAKLKEKNT